MCTRTSTTNSSTASSTLTKQYVLGDPLDQKTTLGPMAQQRLAATVRDHIGEAMQARAPAR